MASKSTTKGRSRSRTGQQGRKRQASKSKGESRSAQGESRHPSNDAEQNPKRSQRGGAAESKSTAKRQAKKSGGGERQRQNGGTGSRVVGSIKEHPLTAAAIGAGVGLLAAQGVRMAMAQSQRNQPGRQQNAGDEDAPEAEASAGENDWADEDSPDSEASDEGQEREDGPSGHTLDAVRDRAASLGRAGRAGASRVRSALRSSTSALGHAAQEGYQRGREAAFRSWEERPLTMAAAALAAGATLALLLPRTRSEDHVMGKWSDRIAGRVKTAGQELFGQGKEVVTRAISEGATATAREAEREGLTPGRLGHKIKRVASSVRDAVANAVQEE